MEFNLCQVLFSNVLVKDLSNGI